MKPLQQEIHLILNHVGRGAGEEGLNLKQEEVAYPVKA